MIEWSSMVRKLKQKYGDEKYEWLVARHIEEVIYAVRNQM